MEPECPDGNGGVQCPAGGADEGEQEETHEEFGTRVKPGPVQPSSQDIDQHETTGHSVYRDWCASCVCGRGRAGAHTRREHEQTETPVLSFDYGFLGNKSHGGEEDRDAESSGQSPVLCVRDRKSHSCFWYVSLFKGADFPTVANLVRKIVNDIRSLGYNRAIIRSDGERPILRLLHLVTSAWEGEAVPEVSAEGDHASNGGAECGVGLMKGHTRTLKISLENKLQTKIPDDHPIITWIVQFASRS